MEGRWVGAVTENDVATEADLESNEIGGDGVFRLQLDLLGRNRFAMELRTASETNSVEGTWKVVNREQDRMRVSFTALAEGESRRQNHGFDL